MLRSLAYWLVGLALCAQPALAATKEDLAKTKSEMQEATEREAKLAADSKDLESELLSLQKMLVDLAAMIQKSETELTATEEKLAALSAQLKEKNAALEKRKAHMESLIEAALHLSRTPPEAIVLMPGDSKETMTAARALKMATSGIKDEAEEIRQQIEELSKLQQKVAKHRDELTAKRKSLDKERSGLKAKLEQRSKLQEKLSSDREEEAQKAAKLARKAEDLQGLLSTVSKTRRDIYVESKQGRASGAKGKVRSFIRAKGDIRVPAAGHIVRFFGDASGRNETSRGLSVLTRGGAGVIAPYDGEVVFTGPFLNYGKMVIIRHSDDFHTLLVGLSKIDIRPGEFLLEGEPIGAMPDRDSEAKLYIELRKDNQPIDPAPWMNIRKN
jgi:septal ring factor EnvC (AmiA/AmiB activator)